MLVVDRFHEREFRGVACREMVDLFVGHLGKRVDALEKWEQDCLRNLVALRSDT
jgi:hypothetical protein